MASYAANMCIIFRKLRIEVRMSKSKCQIKFAF